MKPLNRTYADFEGLRRQAIALRRQGYSLRQIGERLQVSNKETLSKLVKGEPAPEWTHRPNVKKDLRDRARELRLKGLTYDQIQSELGCSKSSISLWVRDLPKPPRRPTPRDDPWAAANRGRQRALKVRRAAAEEVKQRATAEITTMSDHELLVTGVALYWAEGAKRKAGYASERVIFVNSDPSMIGMFLKWLDLVGTDRDRLRFAVYIHESADVAEAERFWANHVGIDTSQLQKTVLKTHNPRTRRTNRGADYRGCLRVVVRDSADPLPSHRGLVVRHSRGRHVSRSCESDITGKPSRVV